LIRSNYLELLENYGVDSSSAERLWSEVNTNYSKKNRHYHNLNHLEDLLSELKNVKDKINNWEVVLFALYYHDIIYKSTKKDNEEKSAELASKRMNEIGVKESYVKLCHEQIIATKGHNENSDSDTNYFTDADLSILGRTPTNYKIYCSNIRKEYFIYPNFVYKKGRKKVVNHFLSMEKIFKTDEFYYQYEAQAKLNLQQELKSL
tara:strand:+ start:5986 stop:6600 length:615 start_codon:yes stop_codon:yes gene_type:complete